MAHWDDKDSWLHGALTTNLSELWHGQRFQEHASFWVPDATTLLPSLCTECLTELSTKLISSALDDHDTSLAQVQILCPRCVTKVLVVSQYTQGDLRNQVVVIHEDGWAPHSTSAKHSVAAITITHGCMTKLSSPKVTVLAFILLYL